jgi:hypothetical protein
MIPDFVSAVLPLGLSALFCWAKSAASIKVDRAALGSDWLVASSHVVPPSTSYNIYECSTTYETTSTAYLVAIGSYVIDDFDAAPKSKHVGRRAG